MHGRIKVRSTAEQAEAKRKETEKKLKIYTEATERIYAKREVGELDEEALQITEQLLGANPDFSTMWNLRREIFLHMKDSRYPDKLQAMCKSELRFLESCLRVNPKSYGVWHHREWIMEFMPQPAWRQELNLCNLFLTYDERNFHCWDYRRFVVKKAEITAQEEFNFSTDKIQENFSNYSSWHYRSKLLPLIHPDPDGDKERVEEEALMKEFDLAQNAFFTDPYDQSAWFYHRWLLGRARRPLAISCIYMRYDECLLKVVLQFTQPTEMSKLGPAVFLGDEELTGEWKNPFHNKHPSPVWIFRRALDVTPHGKLMKVILLDGKLTGSLTLEKGVSEAWDVTCETKLFRAELTAVHSSVLQTELESCKMLLEEEPGNKWTLLTMVLLMRALDPLQHEQETMEYIEKLQEVDPYRKGYYSDLGRKFRLENAIERYCANAGEHKNQEDRTLDLSKMDLSHFYNSDQLVLSLNVNLSHNRLPVLDSCNMLQCVRVLDVSNNKLGCITKTHPLRLDSLEQLTLKDNHISDVTSLGSLQECTALRKLDLRGNEVCNSLNYRQSVREMLPSLEWLDGEKMEAMTN